MFRKKKAPAAAQEKQKLLASADKPAEAKPVTAHVTPPPSLPAPAPKAADSVVFEKTSHHEQLSPQASPAPAPAPSHTSIAVTLDTTAATSDSGYLSPKEGFVTRYGYNWDWVLVFPVEPPQAKSPSLKPFEIVHRLNNAGLATYLYYSVQRDEIYCKIRAPLKTLQAQADRMDYKMLLDEDTLRDAAVNGIPSRGIDPVEIMHDPVITPLRPYQYIYSAYDFEDHLSYFFMNVPPLSHPFAAMHRLKVILNLMESSASNKGCGLDFSTLLKDGSILASLPLHDDLARERLASKWITAYDMPWEQPIEEIKDYFGEKIGLMFWFLGHYSTWLLPLGAIGFAVFVDVCAESFNTEAMSTPFFAVFVSFWSVLMLEFWKRTESERAMLWGMSDFESEETDRPEFIGDEIKSFVDGSTMKYFPKREQAKKVYTSQITIMWMIVIVIAAVIGIFWMQIDFSDMSGFLGTYGSSIASLVNSVQIIVLNMLYSKLAVHLTNRENHRTNTQYEDSLIAKLFCFQFVNSYASLFYVAYIKTYTVGCIYGSCMNELCVTLGIIFVTRLITKNLLALLVPRISRTMALKRETKGLPPGVQLSRAELEYILPTYDSLMGPLTDYADLSIQFGYVILFVTAFPLAPILAFISNHLALRTSASKLLFFYRRPIPTGAQDVGTWQTILTVAAGVAVITNAGVICFTMTLLDSYSTVTRVWIFFGLQYGIFLVMALFSYIVPDVPDYVDIQVARNNFLVDHVIRGIKDVDEEFEADESGTHLAIHDFDDLMK